MDWMDDPDIVALVEAASPSETKKREKKKTKPIPLPPRLFNPSDIEARSSSLYSAPTMRQSPLASAAPLVVRTNRPQSRTRTMTPKAAPVTDNPLAYFSKGQRGHGVIYLTSTGPYSLQSVPYPPKGTYYTMSSTGITQVDSHTSDTIPLAEWSAEASAYACVRKLKFFSTYFQWKNFKSWRRLTRHSRYKSVSKAIKTQPVMNTPRFAEALIKFQNELKALDPPEVIILPGRATLAAFNEAASPGIEKFKDTVTSLFNEATELILKVHQDIVEEARTAVRDSDFPARANPNLAQLMLLERRKAIKRSKRVKEANERILAIGRLIRLFDYIYATAVAAALERRLKHAIKLHGQDTAKVTFREEEVAIAAMPRLLESEKLAVFLGEQAGPTGYGWRLEFEGMYDRVIQSLQPVQQRN